MTILRIRTVIKYAYVPCSLVATRKERGIELQPLTKIWLEARCADYAKGRTFHVLPDSRVSSQRSKLLDEPIVKIEAPQTNS